MAVIDVPVLCRAWREGGKSRVGEACSASGQSLRRVREGQGSSDRGQPRQSMTSGQSAPWLLSRPGSRSVAPYPCRTLHVSDEYVGFQTSGVTIQSCVNHDRSRHYQDKQISRPSRPTSAAQPCHVARRHRQGAGPRTASGIYEAAASASQFGKQYCNQPGSRKKRLMSEEQRKRTPVSCRAGR